MKTSTAVIVLVILVVVVGGGWWYFANNNPTPSNPGTGAPVAVAAFACENGKSIGASFYESSSTVQATTANQPPTPTGSVTLTLSDGRSETLPQTISASGIRYANADESFIFWAKGNTAFVQEGANQDQTYTGCIVVAPDPSGALTQIYATSTLGFTIRFPQGFTADQNYMYQELGPGKAIGGVKFTIPSSATTGTNLGSDSYVSVETLPNATSCTADKFIDMGNGSKVTTFSDNGVDYSVATSSGAGAGNLYDEAVFAIPGTSPCTAVRYFIHSSQIANYPAGTVTAFDKASLVNTFDAIRRSLVLGR